MKRLLLVFVAAGLAGGGTAWWAGHPALAHQLWTAGTAVVLLVQIVDIIQSLRRGEFGLDLIAALAMGGALALGESLAGIIVGLMFTGGEALEDFAARRARREMTALLSRVPRTATRYRDGALESIDLSAIAPGDRLLVRRGEVVAVDGTLPSGRAVVDESALTGESLPATREAGDAVMSGATNAGDAFDLVATRTAAESTYAGIVRLVETASASRAPMARLADRYAIGFLGVTVCLAGGAWMASGDPVRALAVLVCATPCPLILAVPVAIISGVSRSARAGVLVKGGAALERLAAVTGVLFDKTGTLTDGRARLVDITVRTTIDPQELLRLAASLDQGSHHVIAIALVQAARDRGLRLEPPADVREVAGAGIEGRVGADRVAAGGWSFVRERLPPPAVMPGLDDWVRREGAVSVVVAVNDDVAGLLVFADEIRPEAIGSLRALRELGITRTALVTGDRADVAERVGAALGVSTVLSMLTPADKIAAVRAASAEGPVMMVGDGVNDAPALAAADVGVAMAARGAAASSEAADVVILVDRLDRVVTAIRIARRSRRIARESVFVGLGLSIVAMIAAAAGRLAPVEGAILQEAIDVAVILNALRALQ